ncbi:aminoacyl-tRNA hydrolase [Caldibacillus thermolactis]|jgi:peptidyl-tRNA hydrolase, PTH1 family|uniref:Peptidyl-tRNA hydrolase n=1 Tax=Pallidibacillus thermolactis TaxID=251051 RepID=A0ABT2WJY2_9BACI|nr:aminoacyl-tRNA hydrolase [Pallidibacillus thermolactis]MCU9601565.1 aminoacyl-tRNA hydrolase [Pallidibacillus thermolactis subsp. kokeshiiformis]MED1672514.1 aminoacyl-tRNA hydrolase [Pallidibacillus thermolactis subsp. kokeshiiformis]
MIFDNQVREIGGKQVKLIVGLGNPGKEYEETRHNIGFKVIDELSKELQIPLNESKFKGLYGKGNINGERVLLLKPMTYMNLSGEAVSALMNFYKISAEELLVIYDELDLPVGKIRLRYKGSAGGHNGIKSIIQHIGTQEFKRIRIGIDRPERGKSISDYVLGKFNKEDIPIIEEMVQKSVKACEEWIDKPFLEVMNIYNQ